MRTYPIVRWKHVVSFVEFFLFCSMNKERKKERHKLSTQLKQEHTDKERERDTENAEREREENYLDGLESVHCYWFIGFK